MAGSATAPTMLALDPARGQTLGLRLPAPPCLNAGRRSSDGVGLWGSALRANRIPGYDETTSSTRSRSMAMTQRAVMSKTSASTDRGAESRIGLEALTRLAASPRGRPAGAGGLLVESSSGALHDQRCRLKLLCCDETAAGRLFKERCPELPGLMGGWRRFGLNNSSDLPFGQ